MKNYPHIAFMFILIIFFVVAIVSCFAITWILLFPTLLLVTFIWAYVGNNQQAILDEINGLIEHCQSYDEEINDPIVRKSYVDDLENRLRSSIYVISDDIDELQSDVNCLKNAVAPISLKISPAKYGYQCTLIMSPDNTQNVSYYFDSPSNYLAFRSVVNVFISNPDMKIKWDN